MQLRLEGIAQQVGSQAYLYPMTLEPVSGAVTNLLGVTQAGKTSLMRVMAGLDRPSAGRVLVDGIDMTGVPVRERNVSMVYQQFINYPSLKVFDNIASPLRLRGKARGEDIAARVRTLAGRLHIDHLLDRYPSELSGGQQQRVAIVRALAMKPQVMLLDEVTSALDPELVAEVLDLIRELAAGGMTMLIATHEMGFARDIANRVCFLEEGLIIEDAPPAELFTAPRDERTQRFLRRIIAAGRL